MLCGTDVSPGATPAATLMRAPTGSATAGSLDEVLCDRLSTFKHRAMSYGRLLSLHSLTRSSEVFHTHRWTSQGDPACTRTPCPAKKGEDAIIFYQTHSCLSWTASWTQIRIYKILAHLMYSFLHKANGG